MLEPNQLREHDIPIFYVLVDIFVKRVQESLTETIQHLAELGSMLYVIYELHSAIVRNCILSEDGQANSGAFTFGHALNYLVLLDGGIQLFVDSRILGTEARGASAERGV